ncbi:MAG: hypothetical protein R2838_17995 [Caldilineaceae bacterium]
MTALGQADLGVDALMAPHPTTKTQPFRAQSRRRPPVTVAPTHPGRPAQRAQRPDRRVRRGQALRGQRGDGARPGRRRRLDQVQVDGVNAPAWISSPVAEVIEMTPVPAAETAAEARPSCCPTPTPGDEATPAAKLPASADACPPPSPTRPHEH